MRVIETEVFTYNELDEAGQDNARDWYRAQPDAWDSSDWWASAQAFCGIAPIAIDEADYDRAQVDISWTGDEAVADLEGVRAWKWLANNGWFEWAKREAPGACTLTGFCGDAAFADPLLAYANAPATVPDLRQVFYEMAQAWVKDAQGDMEGSAEDGEVAEMIVANEYEFTSTGKFVS